MFSQINIEIGQQFKNTLYVDGIGRAETVYKYLAGRDAFCTYFVVSSNANMSQSCHRANSNSFALEP